MSAATSMTPVKCRVCGCAHEKPCILPDGDECMLSYATALCTKSSCVIAAERAAKRLRRQQRDEVAALVRPIAERWWKSWEADRARRRRPGTKASPKKRNPNRKPQGRAA